MGGDPSRGPLVAPGHPRLGSSRRRLWTNFGYNSGMKCILKFLSLPLRERLEAIEAALCLGVARLLILLPFRRLAPLLGTALPARGESPVPPSARESTVAQSVQRALARVADRVPWKATCLVQAIAGRLMLQRRRVPSVLHLGAKTGADSDLAAHAWLSCGDVQVTGADIARQYTAIAAFKP